MNITKTYWLVDLENTGSRWTEAAASFAPGDTVVIFWSPKTCDVSMRSLPGVQGLSYMFVQCCNGTPNALDFQLCAWLGRMSALRPDARFRILSKDKGYSPLEKFLPPNYGTDVALVVPYTDTAQQAHGAPARPLAIREQYSALLEAGGMADAEERQIMCEILMRSMAQPESRRTLDTRFRLSARYGAVDGNLRYKAVRDVIRSIAKNGPWPACEKPSASPAAKPPADPKPVSKPAPKPQPPAKPKAPRTPPVTPDDLNKSLSRSGVRLKAKQVARTIAALGECADCQDFQTGWKKLKKSIADIYVSGYRPKVMSILLPILSGMYGQASS